MGHMSNDVTIYEFIKKKNETKLLQRKYKKLCDLKTLQYDKKISNNNNI